MVFPLIELGSTVLKKSHVAIDAVGHALNENLKVGDDATLYYFRHILFNHVIIGFRSHANGVSFSMPNKGYFGALLCTACSPPSARPSRARCSASSSHR